MRDIAKIRRDLANVQAALERPAPYPARRRELLMKRSRLLEELANAQEAQKCTGT